MCKLGDIILINNYMSSGKPIGRHSFVVIDDEGGTIQGYSYDMICNVLSSFKSSSQMRRKLSYPGNFPITHDDVETDPNNGRNGYVKADQLYYFDKSKIDFTVIGSMREDIFDLFIEFLNEGTFEFDEIIDNL